MSRLQLKVVAGRADMKALEGEVRAIVQDGLLWGKCEFTAHKLHAYSLSPLCPR